MNYINHMINLYFKITHHKTDHYFQSEYDDKYILWKKELYHGEKYNEGYGMRTIPFNDFFNEIDSIIKKGEAINYLYSIKKE